MLKAAKWQFHPLQMHFEHLENNAARDAVKWVLVEKSLKDPFIHTTRIYKASTPFQIVIQALRIQKEQK